MLAQLSVTVLTVFQVILEIPQLELKLQTSICRMVIEQLNTITLLLDFSKEVEISQPNNLHTLAVKVDLKLKSMVKGEESIAV
tara:strand:+ start:2316 stop:2564 length:249 start_codon:yes stop_codon:yes gene_type:complete